jgi:hypothetical protein
LLSVFPTDKFFLMLDRRKLFDQLAYWRTRLSAEAFGRIVGLSRQEAQRTVIGPLRIEYPRDLRCEPRGAGLPQGNTLDDTLFRDPNIDDVVHLALAIRKFGDDRKSSGRTERLAILGFPVEEVRMPVSTKTDMLRALTSAASHMRSVTGTYITKRSGPAYVRFSPRAMVRTPSRIHFRGFLEVSSHDSGWDPVGYRDIVPGRFATIDPGTGSSVSFGIDRDWVDVVDLRFRLNLGLPRDVYAAFSSEHGIEPNDEGHVEIAVQDRKAFAHYYRNDVFARTIEDGTAVWLEVGELGHGH